MSVIQVTTESPTFSTWIALVDLAEELQFIYPVMVKIELASGVFVAECPTFDLFTTAETDESALENLRCLLVEDYRSLLADYPANLTPDARSLLRLYCSFLGKDLPQP